jgi:hypothetical protein
MRRTIPLVVAVLALIAMLVAPAAAAPKKAFTYDVTCGESSFTVVSKGRPPGWDLEFSTSPFLLLGGSYTYTFDVGDPLTFVDPVPPGMADRLTDCVITGPNEVADFSVVVDPAYLFFPAG